MGFMGSRSPRNITAKDEEMGVRLFLKIAVVKTAKPDGKIATNQKCVY
jgi:hypothetical protein